MTQPVVSPGVDRALAALERVGDLAVPERVAAFDEVHRHLQDALATLDDQRAPAAGAR